MENAKQISEMSDKEKVRMYNRIKSREWRSKNRTKYNEVSRCNYHKQANDPVTGEEFKKKRNESINQSKIKALVALIEKE